MNHGPNPHSWTHGQAAEINENLRQGLRGFYNPKVLPGEKYSHQWTFLRQVHRMTLVAGQWKYKLPASFAMFDGSLHYPPGSSTLYPSLTIMAPESIRSELQRSAEATGRPVIAAFEASATDKTRGTIWELLVFPVPDQDYPVDVKWKVNAQSLGEDVDLPLGGQPHAQTLIASCLSATESYLKSGATRRREFEDHLLTSVSHDRMQGAPDTVGYIGDSSDAWHDSDRGTIHDYDQNLVTHTGHGGYPSVPLS
jgi:hypothetical protein